MTLVSLIMSVLALLVSRSLSGFIFMLLLTVVMSVITLKAFKWRHSELVERTLSAQEISQGWLTLTLTVAWTVIALAFSISSLISGDIGGVVPQLGIAALALILTVTLYLRIRISQKQQKQEETAAPRER